MGTKQIVKQVVGRFDREFRKSYQWGAPEFMRSNRGFDLVLIDGDHEENACRSDFEAVGARANICVLHDITNDASPGSGRVWNRIKAEYSEEYEFFEYTDQYESVRRRTGHRYLGIGVAARRPWIRPT